jgi:hypothetical protein
VLGDALPILSLLQAMRCSIREQGHQDFRRVNMKGSLGSSCNILCHPNQCRRDVAVAAEDVAVAAEDVAVAAEDVAALPPAPPALILQISRDRLKAHEFKFCRPTRKKLRRQSSLGVALTRPLGRLAISSVFFVSG